MTVAWHVPQDTLAAYLSGTIDAVDGASVEQHLVRCGPCRDAVRPLTPPADLLALDRTWQDLTATLLRPPLPAALRLARTLGLREPVAVLLAVTGALRTAWLLSALGALGFALAASLLSREGVLWPFLLVAPLVPVIGVAGAYGPSWDPLEGLVVTAPYGRTRLILVRTAAVLVSCLPAAALLGLLLPGPGWVAVAWLGPALALIPVTLALASFVGPRLAAAAVTLAWSLLVAGSVRTHAPTWPVEPAQQLGLALVAAVAIGILMARSRADRRLGVTL